jgi:hypothetical protein
MNNKDKVINRKKIKTNKECKRETDVKEEQQSYDDIFRDLELDINEADDIIEDEDAENEVNEEEEDELGNIELFTEQEEAELFNSIEKVKIDAKATRRRNLADEMDLLGISDRKWTK